jgi:stage V sporulation protein AC
MEKTVEQARNDRYSRYVESVSPKTSAAKSLFHSFWLGGLTCVLAQIINDLYKLTMPSLGRDMTANLTLMTVVTAAILLTGLGVFDKMARFGGAGLFLPITGFANAISSAAMEYKAEGLILGTSTKMFTVVGPVLVNGVVWSTLAGIIHLLIFGRI